jgi:hypothetical protein
LLLARLRCFRSRHALARPRKRRRSEAPARNGPYGTDLVCTIEEAGISFRLSNPVRRSPVKEGSSEAPGWPVTWFQILYHWSDSVMQPRRTHRSRRRSFSPSEPEIVAGEFVGRKLSELSDEELNRFLKGDARYQPKSPSVSFLLPSSPWCADLSQYWFAKYELERRKLESQRDASASLTVLANDTEEGIAKKLAEYGFRAASRKYHPDHGGDTATMQRLNAGIRFARDRLKS